MPLTPTYGLPYPDGDDTADSPRDVKALADAVARELGLVQAKAVNAGAGLTGGGTLASDRTINVGAGPGINVQADLIQTDTVWTDARYVKADGTTAMTGALSLPAAAPTATVHASHKGYVDSRIWTGTQAAYDAIGTKDASVLYVITG